MTLHFLLDEDIPPAVAEGLRQAGCDAISVHQEQRTGLADEEQLRHAAALSRVLVTYNRADFQALNGLWHARGEHHTGILWVTERSIPRRAIGLLVHSLVAIAGDSEALDEFIVHLRQEERM